MYLKDEDGKKEFEDSSQKRNRYFMCPHCNTYSSVMRGAKDWERTYLCVSCNREFKWFDGSQPIRDKEGNLVAFTRNFQGDI